MSETSEKFIQAFEKIKAEINQRAGEPRAFEFKLDSAANKDRFVQRNLAKLRYIRVSRVLEA
jgi:hypothetical protein